MSQPPENPPPEHQPWRRPGPPQPDPQQPYGSPPPPQDPYLAPPAYGGTQPYPYDPGAQGGLPQYGGGVAYGQDPAAGLASRWARLGGAIIDGIILTVVYFVISLPFVDWTDWSTTSQGNQSVSLGQYAFYLVPLIISFLYYWLVTYTWHGQTIGKKALGIRVVRAEDRGPISNSQALMRSLVYVVLGNICACFGLINVLWILWDRRRQCLHDKAARTVVVKVHPGDPDPYATTAH